jgi:hypothetical protein
MESLHVDHDHVTGAVRALLCFDCNAGVGKFRDDPTLLRTAGRYVLEHRLAMILIGLNHETA